MQVARDLLEARSQVRSPADGGGRAWIEAGGDAVAGAAGRWTILYEAGPEGIAAGGALYLQVSPFWGWSTPQTRSPGAQGFTLVSTEAEGVELEPRTLDQQLLGIFVRGRALAAGDVVRIEYGAGRGAASADLYAEACGRLWLAVDGDGDGVRGVLVDSPCVRVLPARPAQLVVHVPSVLRPGETARVVLAVLDRSANAVREVSGELLLAWEGADGASAYEGQLALEAGGRLELELAVPGEGVQRLTARLTSEHGVFEAESNPLDVNARAPRVLWGDLHGHSADSDGTGTPADYFDYAQRVAGLDVAALTDHDHWGLLFLDEHPELWAANVAAARAAEAPGRFLALPGYEWTSWIWGHRHVLFFGEETPMLSSIDAAYDTPTELWAGLAGLDVVTVPHHPAGGPVPVDWRVAPDARFENALEIGSAHGSSEVEGAPKAIYSGVPGAYARDALAQGHRYGFLASGDGHDGHPGLTHLGPTYPMGGLVAFVGAELSREGVLGALRGRRTYGTSGPRALLRMALDTAPMGGRLSAPPEGRTAGLYVRYVGTAPVSEVTVVRSGVPYAPVAGEGLRDVEVSASLEDLKPGEHVYVRVDQEDGHMAWSSPVFVEAE